MIVEVYDKEIENILKYYGNETDSLSHFPFNFNFITDLQNRTSVTGTHLKDIIDVWMKNKPSGGWPNFVVSLNV